MKRRLLTILLAGLLAVGFAAGSPASAQGGGDNTAIAINTKDGATVFRIAFAIRHVMNGVVDQGNAAVAVASCTECATVAIAIEIVLVESNANVVTPTNLALAFNNQCTLCLTVANAYQFVLSTGGAVHFDAEGNKILAEIKNELEKLKHETLTLAELQSRLDSMIARIRDVLANHLVPNGPPQETETQTTTTTTSTTTTTTPSTTAPTTTEQTTTTDTTTTTGVTTTTGP
jgi:putative peptide zinc metalloprotease protein